MVHYKALSCEEKFEIISDTDPRWWQGMKQVDTTKKYGTLSTIATFLKKQKDIEDAVEKSKVDSKWKRFKCAVNDDIHKYLLRWFHQMRNQNLSISGPMISEKASKFTSLFGNNDFKASNGWLTSFYECHRAVFKTIAREEKSASIKAALSWK